MIEVVGLGALNIDKVYKVERIAKPGEEVFIYDEHISPGGSAANTIYALAKLGIKTGFIGIIGDDYYSNIIIEEFKEAGVDISRIRVVKGRCGEVLCIVDKSGERCLYVNPGVNNLLTLNEDDLVYINSAKILHMSSFVGEKQLNEKKKLLNNIKALISFAPGHVYVEKGLNEIEDIVAKSYILFLNKSEAEILTGRNYKEAARMLLIFSDFQCFSRSNTDVKTYICKVQNAVWEEKEDNMLVFTITADRFLRNMVRAIVGTLLDVGYNKITTEDFKIILNSKDRTKAGASAPAHGLYLTKVKYPKTIFI